VALELPVHDPDAAGESMSCGNATPMRPAIGESR
jgi:hypothetical protein